MKKNKRNGKIFENEKICDKLEFAATEAYKRLRTNIMFSFASGSSCKVIGVTSSIRGEGKSFTSINLAYSIAQSNKRVVLIDADLRIPTVAKKLGRESVPGLTNVLVSDGNEKIIKKISYESSGVSFDLIPAGELPPNPAELLGSKRMENLIDKLRDRYDYIIVDLPPVCVVADAAIFAKLSDGMVVVVREAYCRNDSLRDAVSQLQFVGANILGFVYNASSGGSNSYSKYGKYGKYYHYVSKAEKQTDE